ncbi:hypothetical protein MO867_17900 [Microbulbifer sp. OS29]|uniref:Uncharacterized protein n=1 Tax=Microbulbifer okhotskensis TaxID=2926617 RepID=A0A9X2J634_9GAMM|nr:hypothetical protein [Microbulbifer okhotskensis]MCO1336207.1 hypothetical protein [Microbulbifer okhotskensis]
MKKYIPMKRFALFTGAYNLLMGGIKDFKRSYATEEGAYQEVERIAQTGPFTHWAQIFDKKTDTAKIYRIKDKKITEDKPTDCPHSKATEAPQVA